jgi:peptide deformylase
MLKLKDILDEKDKRLHKASNDVTLPFSKEEKKLIKDMLEYLTKSQIEEYAEKYNLRPGMGLAAIQLGLDKRFFVIVEELPREDEKEKKKFQNYIIANPKIISYSEELIYAGSGEGCLSVNREVEGIVPRHARVTIEYQDEDGKKQVLRAREELAIAVQHEIDHLNGILFVDKIDKNNPYKNEEKMRMI